VDSDPDKFGGNDGEPFCNGRLETFLAGLLVHKPAEIFQDNLWLKGDFCLVDDRYQKATSIHKKNARLNYLRAFPKDGCLIISIRQRNLYLRGKDIQAWRRIEQGRMLLRAQS
jgi:hypothetical protein